MFSVPLESLPLSRREKALCIRGDLLNAAQILHATPYENPNAGRLFNSTIEADNVREVAVQAQAPTFSSVLDILDNSVAGPSNWRKYENEVKCESESEDSDLPDKMERKRKSTSSAHAHDGDDDFLPISLSLTLTTGDPDMDKLLGGGLRRGCLTEIVGESASGKSQLGMQSAVFAALGLKTLSGEEGDEDDYYTQQDSENDLYTALLGCGIHTKMSSVAILNSEGDAANRQIIRRMEEMTDVLIEERWTRRLGEEKKRRASSKKMRSEGSFGRRSGMFIEGDYVNTLQEAQHLAKRQLRENLHLSSAKNYESLEHAISYTLPALAARLRNHFLPPLSLIIVDDLPGLIIEDNDTLAANSSQKGWTLKRSRMLCEISDRLKRLAFTCCGSGTPSSAAAVMVMNQVMDTFARSQDVLRSVLDNTSIYFQNNLTDRSNLSYAAQDGFFNGILASADTGAIREAKRQIDQGHNEKDVLEWLSSTTKMAALGYSWVNCINVRIMLSRTKRSIRISKGDRNGLASENVIIRRAVSVLNPFAVAGNGSEPCVEYVIEKRGFVSLSGPQNGIQDNLLGAAINDEDQLWSSFEKDISTADLSSIMEYEDQARIEASATYTDTEENTAATESSVYDDDEELWRHQSSDWEGIEDLPLNSLGSKL